MKATTLIGIALIVLGGLALAYKGIEYSRDRSVVDLGAIQVKAKTHERIPFPPILGGLVLAGGVALLILGTREKSGA